MTQLIVFRDHCRRMADKCAGRLDYLARRHRACDAVLAAEALHERDLWDQLAGEIDAYLTRHPDVVQTSDDDQPLWEETP